MKLWLEKTVQLSTPQYHHFWYFAINATALRISVWRLHRF